MRARSKLEYSGYDYEDKYEMKTYKVIETSKRYVEQVMNDMAKQGWEVVAVTYWKTRYHLIITFAMEAA